MGQYGLPQKQPMTPGTPRVSPAIRELHGLLDTSVGELIKTKAPQYSSMLPADLAGKPLREIINTSNFLMRGTIMSYLEPEIRKMGLTPAQVEQAVKEAPPPPEPPAAVAPSAVAAPPPPAAAAATAAPAAVAPPPAAAAAPAAPPPASQYALPPAAPAARGPTPQAAGALPGGAGPKAFVFHHTGGGSSAKGIVDDWRTNRPGIGTQYIMDRDGVIHDVKAEFGYGGSGHVHPGYTPKEFKDKGIVNKNIIGMEIMAKDAKDVTPAQAAAAAKFVQEKYPQLPVYGHGELNPGHREADEGQTAKAAVMALRNNATPSTAVPEVQAGAGPAAIAAARKADLAPAPAAAAPAGAFTDKHQKAFLDTIAKGESGGDYSRIIGGGKITDFSQHPRQVGNAGKYGSSDAAGKYQFLSSTWDEQAKKYGYKDFGEKSQDTAAWNYANDVYKAKSGRDLKSDLASGDPKTLNEISTTLGKTWTSLPGGSQPNSNWKGQDFASVYKTNLGSADAPRGSTTAPLDPTPDVGAGESGYQNRDTDKLVDPTPNVGSGEEGYKAPAASPLVDPTPNVGSGASDYGGGGDAMAGFGGSGMDFGKMGGGVGDLFAGIADAFSKGPVAQNAASKSSPANAPLAALPTPPGVVPIVDPKVADHQRQMLAMALQRLNSGKLV